MRFNRIWHARGKLSCSVAMVAMCTSIMATQAIAADQNAVAANPEAQAPAGNNSGELEEIIVSAQHRKENLQAVPIAVAAFSAEQAASQGITNASSLADMVPGLTFNRQAVSSIPFLRGVGTSVGEAGDEPSIAFYVDDVYYPAGSGSVFGFNNIDRMEVEKGPQGTLFGRNATGGVVQVFTKDPTPSPVADVSLGYSNYNTRIGSLYASSALTDTLTGNISLYGNDQGDGWGRNLETGKPTFRDTQFGGRIKLLWTPDDATSALLTIDADRTTSQTGTGIRPFAGTIPFGGTSGVPTNFYDLNLNQDPDAWVLQGGASLKVLHDFDWAKLTSISAYRLTRTNFNFDEDLGPDPFINIIANFKERTATQEFRLESKPDAPLKWMTGLFYFNDVAGEYPLVISGPATAPLPAGFISSGIQSSDSFAGFGEATATILPDTHLTGGLRYTVDERTFAAHYTLVEVGAGSFAPQSKTFEKITYRLNLDHQFTADALGYIAYNRGFKSGLFNVTVQPTGITPPVNPEVLDSYTIGAKTEWLDHRLKVNAEGFWYMYNNIQIDEVVNGGTVLYNAASATIKGIDLDVQAKPIKHLTITASAEAMDGHYDSFPAGVLNTYVPGIGLAQTSVNLTGNHTVQTPPFSFSAAVNYVIPTDETGTYSLTAALSHIGNYYGDPDNGQAQQSTLDDRQPIVNLVNLTAAWTSPTGNYDVTLWGKNVTGEKYYSQIGAFPFGAGYSPAAPSTYGVTATYHFGS